MGESADAISNGQEDKMAYPHRQPPIKPVGQFDTTQLKQSLKYVGWYDQAADRLFTSRLYPDAIRCFKNLKSAWLYVCIKHDYYDTRDPCLSGLYRQAREYIWAKILEGKQ
jgi:hypothetical protein